MSAQPFEDRTYISLVPEADYPPLICGHVGAVCVIECARAPVEFVIAAPAPGVFSRLRFTEPGQRVRLVMVPDGWTVVTMTRSGSLDDRRLN